MTEWTDLLVKVPKDMKQLIEEKELFEIVCRDRDKRYMPFIKGFVIQNPNLDAKRIFDVLQPAAKALEKKNVRDAVHMIKNIDKHMNITNGMIKNISSELANMSVDFEATFDSLNTITALSYVNVALTGLNLAATVAGFVVIGNMLNNLDVQIRQLDEKVDRLVNNELDKIHAEYHKLVMRFNSISQKLKDGDKVDRDLMEGYLRDTNTFIKERLISSIKKETFDIDDLLTMIDTLLPSYTIILCEFQKDYYFDKHHMHDNNQTFMLLYEELQTDEFINTIYDYLFLERGFHANEALISVTLQKVLINDQLIEIYDQHALMRGMQTEEKFNELNQLIDESVKEQALNSLAQHKDEEDYSQIVLAINKTYQTSMMA